MKPLNWSIIGLGRFGRIHADTLRGMPGIQLDWACSRNAELLNHHATELDLTKTTTDYQDILNDPSVDVVSITTHWEDHYQITLDALESGKHVLLEKPMAATAQQCAEITACSKRNPGKFMVGHICRFDARYVLAREAIQAGQIGNVTSIHARRNLPVAPGNIRLDKISPLIGDGIHDLDLAMWILGRPPNSVFAHNTRIHDYQYPDISWALFDFNQNDSSQGTVVVIETNWALPANTPTVIDARMEINGTTGQITVDCSTAGLKVQTLEGTQFKDTIYWPRIHEQNTGVLRSELEYFANCIRSDETVEVITADEAGLAVEMILLAEQSAATGKIVSCSSPI